jgi:Na+-driven multidrug efflux pump
MVFKNKLINLKRNLRLFFDNVSEAVSGSEQDYTEGKLSRAILLLSIPAILEMVMESIFVIADIFFVSKLGADAVATVGITESMLTIIFNINRTWYCNNFNSIKTHR